MSRSPTRDHPPLPGPGRPVRFPDFEKHRLPNGLDLILCRRPASPLVQLQLATPGGATQDPPGLEGLATLGAGLLDEGTEAKTALQIAGQVERLGGHLATFAGWDACHLSLGTLSSQAESAFELVAELVSEANWPESELERLKRLRLTELLAQRAHPSSLAERALLRAVYGGQRYGTPPFGTRESVSAIERTHIVELWSRFLGPVGSTLIIAGDLRPECLAPRIEAALGRWAGNPEAADPIRPPETPERPAVIVDRPEAVQSVLRIGWPGPPRDHPDFTALEVASCILGGKFTSRLNLRLRERDGFTYGVHSRLSKRKGPAPFTVSTALANETVGRAAGAVRDEVRRLGDDTVPAGELKDACSYLEGLFTYSLQGLEGVASKLVETAVYGLPDDHFATLGARLRSLEPAAIRRVAQRYLGPETMVLAVAGPARELAPQLTEWGEPRVLNQDLEAREGAVEAVTGQ